MSEATTDTTTGATGTRTAPAQATLGDEVPAPARGGGRLVSGVLLVVAAVLLLIAPFFLDPFWLRTGFGVFAAVVGALGLNLLVGNTGQLSLAHAFFLAVGATTYCFVSGEPGGTATEVGGLGLPPVVGMVLGMVLAGVAGLLFSPIAARLRGIYLGVASISLVFIGQHVLNVVPYITGGFNGRPAPTFTLFGFSFADEDPPLAVLGIPFREPERLWYLGLFLAAGALWFAHNLLRSRAGRALQTLRDSEVAAAVMGVDVQVYKAKAFAVSSVYAGLAGVLTALSIGSIAPESFALDLSVLYLAMVVLGGLGSVWGSVIGAAFVSALPVVFQRYADVLPLLSEPGQGGITAAQGARLLFGLAIVLIVLFEPAGLVGLGRRLTGGGRRRRTAAGSDSPVPTTPPAQGSTS